MNIHELLNELPPEHEVVLNGDGSRSLEIGHAEEWLDKISSHNWSTANFKWQFFTDHNDGLHIGGSLEVYILFDKKQEYEDGHISFSSWGKTLTGAANFKLSNMQGNTDFLATLKSLCIKNSLTDIGIRGGRFLNEDRGHVDHREERSYWNGKPKDTGKEKPSDEIRLLFARSLAAGDTDAINHLESKYEFRIG